MCIRDSYTVRLDFTTESSIRKQAWMENPDGSGPVYGTLEGLLALAPTGSTIKESNLSLIHI